MVFLCVLQPTSCQAATQHWRTGARYTWRHDSALLNHWYSLQSQLGATHKIYADLPGLRASDGPEATIPIEVAMTTLRRDIVTIQGRSLHMLELTVCGNTCDDLAAAHKEIPQARVPPAAIRC